MTKRRSRRRDGDGSDGGMVSIGLALADMMGEDKLIPPELGHVSRLLASIAFGPSGLGSI